MSEQHTQVPVMGDLTWREIKSIQSTLDSIEGRIQMARRRIDNPISSLFSLERVFLGIREEADLELDNLRAL